jgi:hypothetical protein
MCLYSTNQPQIAQEDIDDTQQYISNQIIIKNRIK